MKQSLQLRLGQQLTMTPQLQQAIRLLQLSTLELRTEIQQAIESNMMLEMSEDGGGGEGGAEADWGTESGAERSTAEQKKITEDRSNNESDVDLQQSDMPDDLPVDSAWEDVFDSGPTYSRQQDLEGREFEHQDESSESLHEHLLWQMRLTPFSETDVAIATSIIDSISDDGYLDTTAEEIHQGLVGELDIELDEVEAVLHRIQNFDPPGVAARDLGESLLLQLQQLEPDTPWLAESKQLVTEHLDLLASHDYTQLMRRLKLGEPELQQIIALIQSLHPRPGSQIHPAPSEYIIPDVYVRKEKGVWKVELNPEASPRLRVNPYYARLVRRANNTADNNMLKNHLQEARWFIKSLQSRNETLLKVASCIVERQRGFLEHGEEAMKPLILHDVAEAVDMHESTISRVTTRKYMHTPRGIFELKYFFSSHVGTTAGGECSSTAIRAIIKKLIAAEHSTKPLSDSKIAQILAEQGINVARRTVAKYREAMAIPPSNERKRLA